MDALISGLGRGAMEEALNAATLEVRVHQHDGPAHPVLYEVVFTRGGW